VKCQKKASGNLKNNSENVKKASGNLGKHNEINVKESKQRS
jgi:hypothetical protein